MGKYIKANFYRFWERDSWLKSAINSSTLFPGAVLFGYIC